MKDFFSSATHTIFTGQMLLALFGAYLTNYYEANSHYYWLLLLLVWIAFNLIPQYQAMTQQQTELRQQLFELLQYWAGSVFAVIIVYALHHNGRISIHETSLLVLLVLALSFYFDGIRQSSKRTAFIGCYLGLIVLSTAFPDTYLWQLALLTIISIGGSYFYTFPGNAIRQSASEK